MSIAEIAKSVVCVGAMLDEMRYADCVLKEQLRMYPVVPAVWRRTLTDIEVGGKRIPKVSILHRCCMLAW